MADRKVSYNEFLAFQLWLSELDLLRAKIQQFRYLDYEMFEAQVLSFCKNNEFCKKNKIKMSDAQIRAIFTLLDVDESGELEHEEIMEVLQDRQRLGQSRDTQAKQDAIEYARKQSMVIKKWFKSFTGY